MLLLFIIFVFYICHIHFLLKFLFLGVSEATFFYQTTVYQYNEDVALTSLYIVLSSLVFFIIGYKTYYRKKRVSVIYNSITLDFKIFKSEIFVMNFFAILVSTYMLSIYILGDGIYGKMVPIKADTRYLLELRIFYLILLSHLFFNISFKNFFFSRKLIFTRIIFLSYIIVIILFQARSLLFEILCVCLIPILLRNGDKIRLKYCIILVVCSIFIPNILILYRTNFNLYDTSLFNILTSIEYSIILNKYLGSAITFGNLNQDIYSFFRLYVIIPGPLRNYFELNFNHQDMLQIVENSGVKGGSFSIIAQIYVAIGWWILLYFFIIGLLLGNYFKKGRNIGYIPIHHAISPLIFSAFILSIRNDIGPFLKSILYIILFSLLLSGLFRNTVAKSKLKEYSN